MAEPKYHPQVDQDEHDDAQTPPTKRALMYGWDTDNTQKVRIAVDSDGKMKVTI